MTSKPKAARSDPDPPRTKIPSRTLRPSSSRRARAMAVAGTSSKRQQGSKRVQTRPVARPEPNTDIVITPDDRAAFAWVALDERGNVRIHASEEVKGYLDETSLSSQFQQAYEQSRTGSTPVSRRGAFVPEEEDREAEDAVDRTITAPAANTSSRRILQPVRQRGRQLAPHPMPVSMYQTPPETPVESAASSPKGDRFPASTQMMSLRIDDAEAVGNFIIDRLRRMQQLADKKIAKAWIKGICPKKQAKFPYQNNKQLRETGIGPEIPVWWPELDVCRFVEPDHIGREERVGLCLHLLRLRPTPAQIEQWNKHDTPSSKTHRLHGWTAWLMELAGHEIFEDLQRLQRQDDALKTQHHRSLMTQMYEVARMEEEYLDGGIDGDTRYMYQDYLECSRSKRSKRSSPASTPDYEEPPTRSASRPASSSSSRAPVKRVRWDSRPSTAHKVERRESDLEMTDAHPRVVIVAENAAGSSFEEGGIEPVPKHSIPVELDSSSGFVAQPQSPVKPQYHIHGLPLQGNWRTFDHLAGWHDPSMSSRAEQQGGNCLPYQAPNTFPGRQNFEFPQYQQVQQPFMNHMSHGPQPEFQTVPNTPAITSAGMASMPMDTYSMQPTSMAHMPANQNYALSMTPAQFFMSPDADPTVADFHPPTTMGGLPYQQDGLAERHMAPMQSLQTQGMMPLQQPHPWHQPQQHRHQ